MEVILIITDIDQFIPYYTRIKSRTFTLLEVIPANHIEWRYKQGKFSIGDTIRHIANIERWVYAESIEGRPASYSGCGTEFAEGYNQVLNYYLELHNASKEIFTKLSQNDLATKCATPDGGNITVWKWLRLMIEHEIHHRAQIYTYLNMLNVKTPPIFGLSAEDLINKTSIQQ